MELRVVPLESIDETFPVNLRFNSATSRLPTTRSISRPFSTTMIVGICRTCHLSADAVSLVIHRPNRPSLRIQLIDCGLDLSAGRAMGRTKVQKRSITTENEGSQQPNAICHDQWIRRYIGLVVSTAWIQSDGFAQSDQEPNRLGLGGSGKDLGHGFPRPIF